MEITDRHTERLARTIDKIYGSPKELIRRGFLIGLASGIGGVVGAAIIIILLGFLVSKLGGIPLVGQILQNLNEAVPN